MVKKQDLIVSQNHWWTEPMALNMLSYELQEAEAAHEEARIQLVVVRKQREYIVQTHVSA